MTEPHEKFHGILAQLAAEQNIVLPNNESYIDGYEWRGHVIPVRGVLLRLHRGEKLDPKRIGELHVEQLRKAVESWNFKLVKKEGSTGGLKDDGVRKLVNTSKESGAVKPKPAVSFQRSEFASPSTFQFVPSPALMCRAILESVAAKMKVGLPEDQWYIPGYQWKYKGVKFSKGGKFMLRLHEGLDVTGGNLSPNTIDALKVAVKTGDFKLEKI